MPETKGCSFFDSQCNQQCLLPCVIIIAVAVTLGHNSDRYVTWFLFVIIAKLNRNVLSRDMSIKNFDLGLISGNCHPWSNYFHMICHGLLSGSGLESWCTGTGGFLSGSSRETETVRNAGPHNKTRGWRSAYCMASNTHTHTQRDKMLNVRRLVEPMPNSPCRATSLRP